MLRVELARYFKIKNPVPLSPLLGKYFHVFFLFFEKKYYLVDYWARVDYL